MNEDPLCVRHPLHIQWNLSIEDTIGTQLAVLYTVEPLYRRHHWDPAGCPVYSGNLSIEDTTGTQLAVLYTVEPLYRGHHWDPAGCPVYSGNLSIEETIGTQLAVLYREVALIQR